jgi:hypothetical protein
MRTSIAIVALLLAGCGTPYKPPPYEGSVQQAMDRAAAAPVYPASATATVPCAANCPALMQRAQAWVATHADYRIQTSTPTLVQTFGPVTDQVGEGFTITSADGVIHIQGTFAGTGHCRWADAGGGACFDPAPRVNELAAELGKP